MSNTAIGCFAPRGCFVREPSAVFLLESVLLGQLVYEKNKKKQIMAVTLEKVGVFISVARANKSLTAN